VNLDGYACHTLHPWHHNGDHPHDGPPDREGAVVRYFRHPNVPGSDVCPQCDHTMHAHGWLDNGGPGQRVCPGDYVLSAPDGHWVLPRATALRLMTARP
jgi:hypothetical protein